MTLLTETQELGLQMLV